jgi:cytochrome c551/c552
MNLMKVGGFSLFIIAFFTWFANSQIPQFKTEPPEAIIIETVNVTIDQMVSIGEERFETACRLCHNPALAGRAPDPSGMAVRALERIQDPNYKDPDANGTGGQATTVEEYLRESMMCPGCFVVGGFGVKGTNDMESPMPVINKPPTSLSNFEMDSIIAYLQYTDGFDITVKLPSGKVESLQEETLPKIPAVASNPKALVERLGCHLCHAIGDLAPPTPIGPDLKNIGRMKDAAYIRQSILEPNAVVAEGFQPIMPTDYAHKMTAGELEMLISFLSESRGEGEF